MNEQEMLVGQQQGPPDPAQIPLGAILANLVATKNTGATMPFRSRETGELIWIAHVARGPMAIEVMVALERMQEYLRGNEQFKAAETEFLDKKVELIAAGDDKALKGEKRG